jgi:hypothetical protein
MRQCIGASVGFTASNHNFAIQWIILIDITCSLTAVKMSGISLNQGEQFSLYPTGMSRSERCDCLPRPAGEDARAPLVPSPKGCGNNFK